MFEFVSSITNMARNSGIQDSLYTFDLYLNLVIVGEVIMNFLGTRKLVKLTGIINLKSGD